MHPDPVGQTHVGARVRFVDVSAAGTNESGRESPGGRFSENEIVEELMTGAPVDDDLAGRVHEKVGDARIGDQRAERAELTGYGSAYPVSYPDLISRPPVGGRRAEG